MTLERRAQLLAFVRRLRAEGRFRAALVGDRVLVGWTDSGGRELLGECRGGSAEAPSLARIRPDAGDVDWSS